MITGPPIKSSVAMPTKLAPAELAKVIVWPGAGMAGPGGEAVVEVIRIVPPLLETVADELSGSVMFWVLSSMAIPDVLSFTNDEPDEKFIVEASKPSGA